MAIDITGNPWIIHAADTTAGLVVVWRGAVHVYQVEFMEYASVTDTCDVNRLNGADFWDGKGATDLQTVRSGGVGWSTDGLTVPQNGITSGLVKIFHK